MAEFSWDIAVGSSSVTEYKIREVQLGDGYTQLQQKSLKPKMRKWMASKTGYKPLIEEIKGFFDVKSGRSFTWVTPSGEVLKVRIKSYTETYLHGRVWKLDWEFLEV